MSAPTLSDCHDCGARPGHIHADGCDVERCTVCGGQRLGCDCAGHDPVAAAWSGEWPGTAEARTRGWYTRWTRTGWRSCDPGEADAQPDLNRWTLFVMTGDDPGPSGSDA